MFFKAQRTKHRRALWLCVPWLNKPHMLPPSPKTPMGLILLCCPHTVHPTSRKERKGKWVGLGDELDSSKGSRLWGLSVSRPSAHPGDAVPATSEAYADRRTGSGLLGQFPTSCTPEGQGLASNWTAGLVNVACGASHLSGHSDSCITSLM